MPGRIRAFLADMLGCLFILILITGPWVWMALLIGP